MCERIIKGLCTVLFIETILNCWLLLFLLSETLHRLRRNVRPKHHGNRSGFFGICASDKGRGRLYVVHPALSIIGERCGNVSLGGIVLFGSFFVVVCVQNPFIRNVYGTLLVNCQCLWCGRV